MQRFILLIISWISFSLAAAVPPVSVDAIIEDIYSFLSESEEVDYEDLQEHLLSITEQPINLNEATYDDLAQLRFLSDRQIDAILLYVYQHPMDSLYELRLVDGLHDYEIRDLLPFVCVQPNQQEKIIFNDMFRAARHELTARLDGRYIEDPNHNQQSDPIYTQLRYRYHYQDRVRLGFTLLRPTGSDASGLLYGGYLQIKDFGKCKKLVIGNYQANFGQGLVAASPFHYGKSWYVLNAGTSAEGLRYHSSVATEALQGMGTTIQAGKWNISGWYSFRQSNDSLNHNLIGINTTYQMRHFKIGLTLTQNIYSDSVRYYRDTGYNQHYFRGSNQLNGGLNLRYNRGIADIFGEVAFTQNSRLWGYGGIVGSRFTPISDLGLIALYRYYSPYFDNLQAYAFSETSRLNDENGLYIGVDYSRLAHWRLASYVDLFRFEHVKYGIPYSPSWGYDAMVKISYHSYSDWVSDLQLRAKQKARKDTYSIRYHFTWENVQWRLRSEANANLVRNTEEKDKITWAYSLSQDIQYSFSTLPVSLQIRLLGFRAMNWDNRIYQYENDVLYAMSIPALYGLGGRAYLNIRWKIIDKISLYLRVSETIYAKQWAKQQQLTSPTRTDIHLLFRTTL